MNDDIKVFTQSSIRITNNDLVIYVDPYGIDNDYNDADFVLITHSHYDHFSLKDIAKVRKGSTKFIIPKDLDGKLDNYIILLPGEEYDDETWKGICDDNKKLLEDKIKHDDLIHITERILKPYNLVAKFIDGKDLINAFLSYRRIPYAPVCLTGVYDQNDVLNRLEKYNRLINCDFITPDNFLKLVYNVRKVEYYDDPEKYPFSIEAIKKCVVDSSAYYDVRALLFSIFDKSFSNKMSENEFDMKVEDIELEKKIGQVKLTRTLKNFSQKKR